MSKKKEKNKRKSELRIIFFIILTAAAIFIVSTYAWFTTQKNIAITNLSGIVEVSEGLEVSLDALNWSTRIDLGENMNIIDNAYNGHHNISPKEMLPVSTLGKTSSEREIGLKMLRGKTTDSKKLNQIIVTDEALALDKEQANHQIGNAKYPGYFAFDIFLKNTSRQYDSFDPLQLNYDSSLQIIEDGNDKVGLQNTVRVALAKYGTGEILSGTGEDIVRSGVAGVMADQNTVLQKTGAVGGETVYISDVTMWEPNSNDHVEYTVTNNNKITWSPTDGPKYGTLQPDGYYKFDTKTQMPTYAIKETAIGESTVIEDIYKWDGNEPNLEKQITLQTTKTSESDYKINEGVQNLFSTSNKNTQFAIAPNSIVRLRIYVWLEGQDVDCINYASHGGGVKLNLGLVKGSEVGTKN